jgi:diguanylate cyclase (GGDEF)-like protein
MNLTFALNTVFGSFLVVFLIFEDYNRRHNSDYLQRRLFLRTLTYIAVPLSMDFVTLLLEGYPGRVANITLWAASYIYYVFQIGAYWYLFVFCVYVASKNKSAAKKLIRSIWVIVVAHAVLLLFNFSSGFYYAISPANEFQHGDKYFIRMIVSYVPAAATFFAMFKISKAARKTLIFLMLLLFLFIGTGTTVDIAIGVNLFTWPCTVGSLLCFYFFIIRTDAKIDSLTRIGNRYAFSEFIDRLAHTDAKEKWCVMMIDLDHFKSINDVYGHAAGDMALKDTASIIKSCIRMTDFAARYGGDEFVVAVNGEQDFYKFLANFKKAVAIHNETKKRSYKIEMSYGYDTFATASGQIIQDFMGRIDALMYKNKTERRKQTTPLEKS